MKKNGYLLLIALCPLAGCVHSKATYLADGNKGYAITCNNFNTSWSSCLTRAGKMCRQSGYLIGYSDEINRELIVECKAGESKERP